MNQESQLKNGDIILDGKYQIESLIGEGEFTRVYHVKLLASDEDRALKITTRGIPGVTKAVLDQYRDRFRLEAQLAEKFNKQGNPHVLQVYNFGEIEGQLYIEMEYATGGNLQDKIDEGPLPVERATLITLDVIEGLKVMHQFSAIHRNIKPSNILFDAEGQAKIADWGLAQVPRRRSIRQDPEGRGPIHPGTPEYMSPEQALTTTFLTPSSDIYSLGCVLFETLTGRLWQEAMITVESVRELRPEVPPGMEGVLFKMLQKKPGQSRSDISDPNKRYVTVDAAEIGLVGVLFDEALSAANLSQWARAELLLEQVLLRVPDYERDGRRATIVQANVRRHLEKSTGKEEFVPPRYRDEPESETAPPPAARPQVYERESGPEDIEGIPYAAPVAPTLASTQEIIPPDLDDVPPASVGQHTMPMKEIKRSPAPREKIEPPPEDKPEKMSLGAKLRLVGLILIFVWLCLVTTPALSIWAFNSFQDEYEVMLLPSLFGEEPTSTPTLFIPTATPTVTLTPTETNTPKPTNTPTKTPTPTPVEIGMPVTATPAITETVILSDTIAGGETITITEIVSDTEMAADTQSLTTTEIITVSGGLTETERLVVKKTVLNTENLTGTVSTGVLWVRYGPSPDFRALAKQEEGDIVALVGRNDDSSWLKIKMQDEQEGWAETRYIDTEAPIDFLTPEELPPTPTPRPTEPPAATSEPTEQATSEAPVATEEPSTPAMKYPAPVVIDPPDGTVWTDGETAHHHLEWEALNLAENEFYNVTFIYTKNGELQYFGTNTKDSRYQIPASIFQLQADRGDFQWRVVVREDTSGERGKLDGPAISPESDIHTFTWR